MEQPRVDTGNVRPLRPLRVLVAGRDARFGRVAGFLLARRGFDVERLRPRANVVEAVSRHAVDVVVLDASDSASETGRVVAALEALYPYLTVVVVADDPEAVHGNLQVLP